MERPSAQEGRGTQSAYKDNLRAQLRDNYVQNRSERHSQQSAHKSTGSRNESGRQPVDRIVQTSQPRERFGQQTSAFQSGGELRREQAASYQQGGLRQSEIKDHKSSGRGHHHHSRIGVMSGVEHLEYVPATQHTHQQKSNRGGDKAETR